MIRINLLPVRQTRKVEALRRELTLAGIVGAIVLAVCMLAFIGAKLQAASVGAENKKIQAEIAQLGEDVARVDEMEKIKEERQRKLDVIIGLRAKKTGPVHMLDDLADATPDKLTLTSLVEDKGNITIRGVAISNEVISQFLKELDKTPTFEQVYLVDIDSQGKGKQVVSSSVPLKEFKLTARWTDPNKKEEEPAAEEPKAGKAGKAGKAKGGGGT